MGKKIYKVLRKFPIFFILIQACLFIFSFANPLEPQQCDSNIRKLENNRLMYGPRNGRCEGVYFRVGHESLLLVSFIEYFEKYDLNSTKDLTVEWASPGREPVHLLAQGLIPIYELPYDSWLDKKYSEATKKKISNLYYRMDAVQAGGSNSFKWPINILKELHLASSDMGIIGWTNFKLRETTNKLYLPLRVKQVGNVVRSPSYKIAILPRQELIEVFYSVARLKDNQELGIFAPDSRRLKYSYYPAERVIEFDISIPNAAGIYLIEIGATLKSGGVDTIDIWIYQSR